ncbi:hypothetical protein BN1013_02142 [Candidatus Rubidus massiliensis]|nr:hypothetical protein BN1013_02142 [Candidatus Rubidus massiliensis]
MNMQEIKDLSYSVIDNSCCAVTLEPYQDAQMVNCDGHHSFSLTSVVKIFGKVINGNCEKPGPCPLCRGKVSSYFPNTALQNLVDAIFNKDAGQEHYKQMCETVKKLKMDFESGLIYPLSRTKFTCNDSNSLDSDFFRFFGEKEKNKINALICQINQQTREFSLIFYFNNPKNDLTIDILLQFFYKNKIYSIVKTFDEFLEYKGDNYEVLLSIIRLFMLNNEFDENGKRCLKTIIEFAEKKIIIDRKIFEQHQKYLN